MQKNTRKEWPFLPDMKSISFNISVRNIDAILNDPRIITN